MANLLKGKDVASSINQRSKDIILDLNKKGITPTLATFRVGEKESDLSYEKGIVKRCEELNIKLIQNVFPIDVPVDAFFQKLKEANNNSNIHGILVFRPLPSRFNDEFLRNLIKAEKDVDGCGDMSLAGVFINKPIGFSPCTAQAAVEILDYYNIDVKGKNIAVIGRSLVVGRPVSMLLMHKNATVTTCHTKTKDIPSITKDKDIIVTCSGQMESLTKEYVNPNQTIVDVGINYNETKQKLCGDVLFEEVEPIVKEITPVPGGVGSVTTSVLINHVVLAAQRSIEN